jgi:hypothetical protein
MLKSVTNTLQKVKLKKRKINHPLVKVTNWIGQHLGEKYVIPISVPSSSYNNRTQNSVCMRVVIKFERVMGKRVITLTNEH